jgi:hypothetical protein
MAVLSSKSPLCRTAFHHEVERTCTISTAPQAGRRRFIARAHAIMLVHSGSHAKAVEYFDSIIPELRVDRGPDGWVASLLHIEAIGRAAVSGRLRGWGTPGRRTNYVLIEKRVGPPAARVAVPAEDRRP